MIEDFKLGWIIGIIEGEGWIGSDSGNRPKIQVSSTDKDTIDKLLEWTGVGVVYELKERTITGKRIWKWAIYAREDAGKFIELILPHLGKRRAEKANEVLALWRDLPPKKGTETHCKRDHELIPENIVTREGRKRCRLCINLRAKVYRAGGSVEDIGIFKL